MSAGVREIRYVLGALGVGVGVYGAWLLLDRQDFDQLLSAGIWLAGGVVLHDFVFVVLVMVLHELTVPRLPSPWRAPATVGAVVLGSVTLIAVPVLGRFGAKPDNPTLLDRDYLTGWLVFAAVVLVGVVVAGVRRSRAAGPSVEQPSAGPSVEQPSAGPSVEQPSASEAASRPGESGDRVVPED